nr:MAG TPA: hypothetical protein [Bacteriophage sp.]
MIISLLITRMICSFTQRSDIQCRDVTARTKY